MLGVTADDGERGEGAAAPSLEGTAAAEQQSQGCADHRLFQDSDRLRTMIGVGIGLKKGSGSGRHHGLYNHGCATNYSRTSLIGFAMSEYFDKPIQFLGTEL